MDKEDLGKYRMLARIAKKTHIEKLFRQPNIVGAAFGRKIVHDRITDDPALVIYVMKKVSKNFLPPSSLLPRKIYVGGDSINVDVVETGPISALAFTARERPAPSGISIGHFNITAGTLGCLVRDLTDGSTCILSNNHVMADSNAASLGDNILQPGPADGGVAADAIATLKRFVMINAAGNLVDAAIAQPLKASDVVNQMKNNLMPVPSADHPAVGLLFAGSCNRTFMNPIRQVLAGLNIDFLNQNAVIDADIGMNVEKVGRTTEYTTSTIIETDVTITVGGYGFGSATFDQQIATMWLSEGGDSGSIVCAGGEGGEEDKCGCGSSSSAETFLQRDISLDLAAEKYFRGKFLSNTLTGRYLLDTYFRNEDYILERTRKTGDNKEDVNYVQHLYDKYAEEFRAMAFNPGNEKRTIKAEHLKEAKKALGRFSEYLQKDEREAASQLFKLAESFEGKTASEALEMLDSKKIYNQVVKIISSVDTLKKDDCC